MMDDRAPWFPLSPQFDGRLDLIHPENSAPSLVDQHLWEFEIAGLLPMTEEPKPRTPAKRHRIRHFIGRALDALGQTDPFAIPMIF